MIIAQSTRGSIKEQQFVEYVRYRFDVHKNVH